MSDVHDYQAVESDAQPVDQHPAGDRPLDVLLEREAAGAQLVWAIYYADPALTIGLPGPVTKALSRAQVAYGVAGGQCPCGAYRLDGAPAVLHYPGCAVTTAERIDRGLRLGR